MGILKKQGGGLPESHFHVFTVLNMGDPPTINGKIGKKLPNRGEGGTPTWEKFPHFPVFFLATSLIVHLNTEDVDIVEEKVPGNEEIAGNSNISSPDFETKGQDYFLHELFNWLAQLNKWECAWRNGR